MPLALELNPPRLQPDVVDLLLLDNESGCAACLLICSTFLHPERLPFRVFPGHLADRSKTTAWGRSADMPHYTLVLSNLFTKGLHSSE